MWRIAGARPPSLFRTWQLTEIIRNEEGRVRNDVHLRSFMRKSLDPLAINDREFIKRYRLNKQAFQYLCQVLREKTGLRRSKRVSLEHKVLCALSFYATGSYQRIVGMAKCLGQTTVSKYIREVTDALNTPAIIKMFIHFPQTRAEREILRQRFFTKHGIPGVIGCIDGSHFHIFTPKKDVEHLFFCRKHYHSLNVQMVCDSDGRIININTKFGGATHDAFVWENSELNQYMQGLHRNNEQTWLLGDSGYPQRPWLMTPITGAPDGSSEAKYTMIHSQTRVIIENTFGRLKNRWRCLCKDRTLHYAPTKCAKIILACSVLHNLAISFSIPVSEDNNINQSEEHDADVYPEYMNTQDALARGRAVRAQLVNTINRLHQTLII